ncbi:uncharacterized protein LOC116296194 [Actinia tenebrosa]|uniref:Uncharacterized protein LOC116296194 n=1 Tax=Actinia tenebrosa TaxID=6105 RepID=A0A6P8HUF2_ACTTE|nr:uncharacterized protein LOC116296194 [Actinia tenebrosa]
MRTLLAVLLLGFVAVAFGKQEKRFFVDFCKHSTADKDCGSDRCCLTGLHMCAPKRGEGQSCNFSGLHGCGCKDGLTCQVSSNLGPIKYYKCLKTPSGSGDGAF